MKSKQVLILAVGLNTCLLIVFKYLNFFLELVIDFITLFGFNVDIFLFNLILPLGVSFFTFQLIAYNVDIYQGKFQATKEFITFAVFVAFFPKLIAGPIERSSDLIPQISQEKRFSGKSFADGFQLLVIGLFKKIVIADIIALRIADFYADTVDYLSSDAIIIVILYSFQIYADFSGYSDMARGISRFFGLNLVMNFNYPYLMTNPRDFWRGWHISLSTWIRDYIYIPLGGNRDKEWKVYRNTLITMLIAGLWHGAGLTFIFWGFLHGIYLIFTRIIQKYKFNEKYAQSRLYQIISKGFWWIFTFGLVTFAWIFFRATSWDNAIFIITLIFKFEFSLYSISLENPIFVIFLFSTIILFIIDFAQMKLKRHEIFSSLPWYLEGLCYVFLILAIISYKVQVYAPFIYAGF